MKAARLPLALLLLFATAAHAPARADTPFAWDLSTVDPSPTAGSSLSLRVESPGVGHVAFWTPAVGVRYGVQQGATWTLETLPDAGVPPGAPGTLASSPDETNLIQHTSVRLALAPDGSPWVAEIDHGRITHSDVGPLAVRHREAGAWVTEWIGESGSPASLEIDAAGGVHAAWSTYGGSIFYARRTGPGTWVVETAATTASVSAMAIAPDGTVHLALTGYDGIVRHALRAPGGGWTVTPVAAPAIEGHTIGAADLALDAADRPAILTSQRDPLFPRTHLRLHRFNGAAWAPEDVDVDQTPKLGGVLAFDDAGNPAVAYERSAESRFVVAFPAPGEWAHSDVDSIGLGNQGMDGAFDGINRPWFATATQSVGVRLAIGQHTTHVPAPQAPGAFRGIWLSAPAPQPARAGSTLQLAVRAEPPGTIDITLVDVRGAVRQRASQAVGAGAETVRLSTRGLTPGLYWVRARDGAGRTAATRVVITE